MSISHINNKNDFTFTNSLAKGMRPEIISMKALIKASNWPMTSYHPNT